MLTEIQYYNLDLAFEKLTKALRNEVKIRRGQNLLLDKNYRIMLPVIIKWMNYTNAQIIKALNKKYINKSFQKDKAGKIVTNLLDWDTLKRDNIRRVKPATLEIFEKGGNQAFKIAGIEGAFDVVNVEAVNIVNKICSKDVKDILDNTKKSINTLIKTGIQEGQAMGKVAKQIRPLVGLTKRQGLAVVHYREKLIKKFPKYNVAKLDKMAKKYSDKLHRYRADMIARTETARAQSEGTLQGYKQLGYKKVEWSANADACSRCVALAGHRFSLQEASGMLPLHPSCRCAWISVIEEAKPKVPGLSPLQLSDANLAQLQGEAKLNSMLLDQSNKLESATMTKERIVKDIAEKLKNNKDFINFVERRRLSGVFNNTPDRIVNQFLREWAGTSGDANPQAIAMQMAAQKEFGLTSATFKHFGESMLRDAKILFAKNGKAYQAFLRAQYNLTQEYFKKQGITHLTGYRGINFTTKNMPKKFAFGDTAKIVNNKLQLQPMSSFSTDIYQAKEFLKTGGPQMLIQSKVPVSRILSTCQTGFGCKTEAEFVLLGGKESFKIITFQTKYREFLSVNFNELFADFKVAPKVPIIPKLPKWKPVMTQVEADLWAKGSIYADDVYYHGTKDNVASMMNKTGFNLEQSIKTGTNGQVYGSGHYLGLKEAATEYSQSVNSLLKVKINVSKIATQKAHDIAAQKAYDLQQLLWAYKDKSYEWVAKNTPMFKDTIKSITSKQWNDLLKLSSKYGNSKARGFTTNYLLKSEGYEAVEVVFGGELDMIIVLDDKFITLIK